MPLKEHIEFQRYLHPLLQQMVVQESKLLNWKFESTGLGEEYCWLCFHNIYLGVVYGSVNFSRPKLGMHLNLMAGLRGKSWTHRREKLQQLLPNKQFLPVLFLPSMETQYHISALVITHQICFSQWFGACFFSLFIIWPHVVVFAACTKGTSFTDFQWAI